MRLEIYIAASAQILPHTVEWVHPADTGETVTTLDQVTAKPEISPWEDLGGLTMGGVGQPSDELLGHLTLGQEQSISGSLCPIFKSKKRKTLAGESERRDSQESIPHASCHLMKLPHHREHS